MKRSPLKRKKSPRTMSATAYTDLRTIVRQRDNGICIGIAAGILHFCSGPYDAEHLVNQKDIKNKYGKDHESLVDPRLAAYCCRWLNSNLETAGNLRLSTDLHRGDLTLDQQTRRAKASIRRHAPQGFEDAVREYGLQIPANRKLGEAK